MRENFTIVRPDFYRDDDMQDFVIESNVANIFYVELLVGLIMLVYAVLI